MNTLAKGLIKAAVNRLPWGANEALFEAIRARLGDAEILARCAQRADYLHLCASGRYGLMQSSLNDGLLLPEYGRKGCYAPRLVRLFMDFFSRHGGGTYLDVGANIGLTTVPIAHDANIRVLAFEPEPVNFKYLLVNVARNCPNRNVQAYSLALFSKRTRLNFVRHLGTNIGDHRVTLDNNVSDYTIEVEAAPLDDFTDKLQGALAVKIDAQGAEPFIIAGGPHVLSQATLAVLEFSPLHMDAIGSDPDLVLEFLMGFESIAIGTAHGDEHVSPMPSSDAIALLKARLAAWRRGKQDYCDVFAFRTAMEAKAIWPSLG